jgi:hypothetical protein
LKKKAWSCKYAADDMKGTQTPYPGKTKEQISFYFLDKKRSNKNWKSKR